MAPIASPYISIIVPVFNAQSYIYRCIDSVLAQSLNNFELILVDDGSTDKSGAICDEYALADSRVRVFHQSNGGVSRARNTGINQARGEYVCFVDSDDYLSPDYLLSFESTESQFDLYVQGVTLVKGNVEQVVHLKPATIVGEEAFGTNLSNYLPFTPQGYPFRLPSCKLFRRSVFDGLWYDPGISMFEDYIVNIRFYQKAKSMRISGGTGYYYDQTNSVLSRKRYPINQFLNWNSIVQEELYSLSSQWNIPRLFEQIVDIRMYFLYLQQVLTRERSIGEKLSVIKYIHSCLNREDWSNVRLTHPELLIIKRIRPAWFSFLILKVKSRLQK